MAKIEWTFPAVTAKRPVWHRVQFRTTTGDKWAMVTEFRRTLPEGDALISYDLSQAYANYVEPSGKLTRM